MSILRAERSNPPGTPAVVLGYVPTKDPNGQFIPDNQHRRPGLYTYLGGWPNFWSKSKVDFNLRQLPPSSAWQVGPFDVKSVMKYFFPAWMFKKGVQSQCYYGVENVELSAGDIAGIREAYSGKGVGFPVANVIRELSKSPVLSQPLREHFNFMQQQLQQ